MLTKASRKSVMAFGLSALCLMAGFAQAAERELDTAYGKVRIKGEPMRVITLDEGALDLSLSIGIKPVGALASRGGDKVANYLQDKASDITIVGSVREPNLEAIFRQKPTLILAAAGLPEDTYKKLSLMAPTVVPEKDAAFRPWRDNMRFYGKALGREQAVEAKLAEIDQRIAALKAKLPQEVSLSVARWNPQGPIVMSANLFVGQIINDLGVETTELAKSVKDRPHSDTLSLENLSGIDADWLFLGTLNADGNKALEDAKKQPAFVRLNAVKQQHVVTVDGQIWSSGSGPLAAEVILTDIEKAILSETK
ncbi:iron-siderophore ABC transporter substrate-binding protein [Pseudomonas sp. F1_0610]|uniref:ABC transporter substrate-binding protein n=1 Tax=Pseudomonas sp. F1_0610 TaxID=3114284 RepID=UPI0039C3B8CF